VIADVAVKLGEALNRDIALTDFFEYPTIQNLAKHLSGSRDADCVARRNWDRGQARALAARLRFEGTISKAK